MNIFNFSSVISEIDSFNEVCKSFIQNRSALINYKQKLKRVRDNYGDEIVSIEITDENPILTKVSDGGYESGGGGAMRVRGKITSVWDIKPVIDERESGHAEFRISGRASTKVSILDEGCDRVCMWKIEMGVEDSPGTHFHIQVEGDNDERPFPDWISVPRFPSILVTIPDAIDFLLGEIFQESWVKHVSESSPEIDRWRSYQQRRLLSLLEWKAEQVNNTMGSAWIAIKEKKPDPGLFLEND